MYQLGNNQGRAYNSTEGKGASEYLSMPLTAQAEQDVAKLNFNFKLQKQKDQEANQSAYYKTLESVKPEGYFLDRQELSDKYNALVDKGSQLMQKGIVNPFASGDPEAIALQKELFQLKQDVDDSKGMETDYNVSRNQLATGDESVWDKKSLEEWKKYYDTPQSERKKNKMLPPKLKKANPYANVTKAVNEQWGNFVKLQKDAGGAITPDMKDRFVENMMNPDNMKAGLEQYAKEMFDGMSDVEKKKLIPLFGTDYEGKLDAVAVTKAVVNNIAENQLFPNISLDANEYFTKTGKSIMDITTQTDAGGVHKVTMVNYGKDREELAKVAESKALFDINTNANLANTLARRYGITETDPATRNRLIAKKAAEDIMATKDKQMKIDNTKPTSVNIKVGDGEKGTQGNDEWLNDLFSGDTAVQKQAVNALKGKNSSLGGVIDNAEVAQENGEYGVKITFTADDPDTNGRRTQQTRFIKGAAEENGQLLDLIQGAKQGQKKDYKRVISPDPLGVNKSNKTSAATDPLGLNK